MAPTLRAAEVVDLRLGARTSLYGGGFGQGSTVGDFYGWAMAFGDIDGDGITDFLSSSANSEGPDDLYGHENDVYLIFGRPRAALDSVYAVDTPGGADIVFYKGGYTMACADIDNDGHDDVILAEHDVYVIFGAPRDELLTVYNFNAGSPDYTSPAIHVIGSLRLGGAVINLQNAGYDFVTRSLVAGDINGDGFADIVIGNHVACDPRVACLAGAAYIIFGRPREQFPSVVDVDYRSTLPHPDVLILGDSNEHYPATLVLGDLDGDGIDDLLASTTWGWGQNNVSAFLGEVHGWWGKRDWKAVIDTQVDDFDFSLQGTDGSIGYTLGYRMAAEDVDGDGRDDLVLGSAAGYTDILPTDRTNMGEYRVLFGRARSLWPKWGHAVDMTDVLILGANTGDALSINGPQEWGICYSFATGNHDGDAYGDLLIGAGHAYRPDDPNPTRPGGAYLIRGRPRSQWEPLIDLRDSYDMIVHGVDNTGSPGYQFDLLGYVTGMGDLDGDGKDELFIAAPFADGPDNSIPDCGEIYVIYGTDDGGVTSTRPPLARGALLPNYPNPFSTSTTFRVQAPPGESVSLTVYDARGREVARPLVGTPMAASDQEFVWAAVDRDGRVLPTGVYFVKLRVGNESHSRKVLLVH